VNGRDNNLFAELLQGVPFVRPRQVETTVQGAAYLAGLAEGVWADREDVRDSWVVDRTFEPTWSEDERASRYQGWQAAVKRALSSKE